MNQFEDGQFEGAEFVPCVMCGVTVHCLELYGDDNDLCEDCRNWMHEGGEE